MDAQRQTMVEEQLRAGGIADERVLDAMGEVPREEFVPDELRGEAYRDGALPIGHGQTISQPWVVAAICSALELQGRRARSRGRQRVGLFDGCDRGAGEAARARPLLRVGARAGG